MAEIVVRFPGKTPYFFMEWRDEIQGIDGIRSMTNEDLKEIANLAAAFEVEALIAGLGPQGNVPIVHEAITQGAVPQMRQPATAQQNAEKCPECGFDGLWKTTKTNKRVLECTNPNHKNDKGYPFAIRWA